MAEIIIKLSDVGMQWQRATALQNVNIDIKRGDFLAITGPNGGGKTTLLRIILKLQKPSEGSVTWIDKNGNITNSLAIGYLPQKSAIDSRFPITVKDVIASGLSQSNAINKDRPVKRMLDEVELADKAHSAIGTLSGGQLQRALLGRAIINEPELLVLDEPLSYIDKHFEQRIYDIIRSVASSTTIVLVSHEMTTIAAMANRHIIVDRTVHECSAAHHMVHYDCDK